MVRMITEPFYVYAYLDPRKPGIYKYDDIKFKYEPFYIGKGGAADRGHYKRCFEHLYNVRKGKFEKNRNPHKFYKIKKILSEDKEPIIKIVKKFGLEEYAYDCESYLIKLIGRLDLKKGPLVNLTDGGIGGVNASNETKKRISNSLKGSIPWNRYVPLSEEQKKDIRDKLISIDRKKVKTIDNRPVHIKKEKEKKIYVYSDERRKKISESTKGRIPWNKNLKGAQVAWNKGIRSPCYKRTDEEKIKLRDSILNVKVAKYSLDGNLLCIYKSQRDAARINGFKRESIKDCCSGRQLSAYGFIWKKLNERYKKG